MGSAGLCVRARGTLSRHTHRADGKQCHANSSFGTLSVQLRRYFEISDGPWRASVIEVHASTQEKWRCGGDLECMCVRLYSSQSEVGLLSLSRNSHVGCYFQRQSHTNISLGDASTPPFPCIIHKC